MGIKRITRGFVGRGGSRDPRLPPGQYDAGDDWPVLTAEPTPTLDAAHWTFAVEGLVEQPTTWTWDEIHALPPSTLRGRHPLRHDLVEARHDLHRRLGRHPARGRRPMPTATHVLALSHTGYTTNLPLADVTGGKAWVAWEVDGAAARRRPRRPGPAARPAPLLLEERQVDRRACGCSTTTSPASGSRTATTTAAIPGSSSATRATDVAQPSGRRRPRRRHRATRRRVPRRSGSRCRRRRATAPASTSSSG